MAAGSGSRDGDLQMQSSRVGDDHSLRLLRQRRLQIGLDREARQLVIRQRAALRAVEQDISFSQGEQVAEVPAADRAKPGDHDFHLLACASSSTG